jgi:hypothetical protein
MANPSVAVSVFPTMEVVFQLARSVVNDAFTSRDGIPGGGRILTDKSSFLIPMLNSGVSELQARLINNGIQTFKMDNVDLTPILPVTQSDPSVQVSLTYTGYSNGTTTYPSPLLPNDLLIPQTLWSRPTGSNLPFKEMHEPQEGLSSKSQGVSLHEWEWRGDGIWMSGATQTQDIRIRYIKKLPFFTGTENFKTTVIPIQGCVNILAYMVASKYALARGATDVTMLDANVEKYMTLLIKHYVRQRQSVSYYRQAYGSQR